MTRRAAASSSSTLSTGAKIAIAATIFVLGGLLVAAYIYSKRRQQITTYDKAGKRHRKRRMFPVADTTQTEPFISTSGENDERKQGLHRDLDLHFHQRPISEKQRALMYEHTGRYVMVPAGGGTWVRQPVPHEYV